MKITILGSGREIGATAFLLEIKDRRILLDAGFHPQKVGVEGLPIMEPLDCGVDVICITHAHLDHIGSLPLMAREFPEARIFMSYPTRAVALRLLHNTVNVMRSLSEKHADIPCQLFTHEDVDKLAERIRCFHFGIPIPLGHGLEVIGIHAGHVLGACGYLIRSNHYQIFYTGDISFSDQELIRGADMPEIEVDILLMENTYSNEPSTPEDCIHEEERFSRDITRVVERGGSVLIPVFALGKTQEMLAKVFRQQETRTIPNVPILVSGLGRAISRIYHRYQRHLRQEVYPKIPLDRIGETIDGYYRGNINFILDHPSIILATSGMVVEDTPSAFFAEKMIRDERHAIFFVGYVDPNLLGHRILHAQVGDHVDFGNGRCVRVQCPQIDKFHFTSHAFRHQLIDLANSLNPGHIILIHGDEEGVLWMQSSLAKNFDVSAPTQGETLDL